MQKEWLCYELLMEKSKELDLTFSDLMAGAVLEEILRRIGESDYVSRLWLRNSGILGKEQYKNNLVLSLEYDYMPQKKYKETKTEQELLLELAEDVTQKIFKDQDSYGVLFQAESKMFRHYVQLNVSGYIGEMEIPVCLKFYLLTDEKLIPQKETFSSLVFPDIKVTYYSYPPENLLAECYMEIITRLELIQNIDAYYRIYHLLEQKSVDGRKVKAYIQELCSEYQVSTKENRMDMIAGYQSYTYMKKKWKVFLRSIHSTEPCWEDVIQRFLKFFEPIWEAIVNDLVFFGDWMPELNRFL